MRRAWAEVGDSVRLLDVDPDLAEGVEPEDRARACIASRVPTLTLRSGAWAEAERFGADQSALYVVSGFLARRVRIDERSSVELLGPGSILRPALRGGEDELGATTSWQVLTPAWLALLDHGFREAMGEHYRVTLNLMDRILLRARALSVQLALAGIQNLGERVLHLLWHLADGYGRVTPGGVRLPVPLSHEMLAAMVSATRPPVSGALGALASEGKMSRDAASGFMLNPAHRPQRAPGSVVSMKIREP